MNEEHPPFWIRAHLDCTRTSRQPLRWLHGPRAPRYFWRSLWPHKTRSDPRRSGVQSIDFSCKMDHDRLIYAFPVPPIFPGPSGAKFGARPPEPLGLTQLKMMIDRTGAQRVLAVLDEGIRDLQLLGSIPSIRLVRMPSISVIRSISYTQQFCPKAATGTSASCWRGSRTAG